MNDSRVVNICKFTAVGLCILRYVKSANYSNAAPNVIIKEMSGQNDWSSDGRLVGWLVEYEASKLMPKTVF